MAKLTKFQKRMINLGKVKSPTQWKKIGVNRYSFENGDVEIFKVEKGKHAGTYGVQMLFPQFHKLLTQNGFNSKSNALYFTKGYLTRFPRG